MTSTDTPEKLEKRTVKNGNGWKVHLFMHATRKYLVWAHNAHDVYKCLRTRGLNRHHTEQVYFKNQDVTEVCAKLIPVDQIYPEFKTEIKYVEWRTDKMQYRVRQLLTMSKKYNADIELIPLSKYIDIMSKKGADKVFRCDRETTKSAQKR
jgi:hypothetical protein